MNENESSKELYGKLSIGVIGAGMMASAIMDGLISKGVVSSPGKLCCSDPSEFCLSKAAAKGIVVTQSNVEVCDFAEDVVILAVKPNYIETVCKDVIRSKNSTTLIISIAAGISIETLEKSLPGRKVVRVMPNTPCLIGEAASAYSMGSKATERRDKEIVNAIFGSVGIIMEVQEDLLNAVTGLSGSGPAYVFEFIEALADGGVRVGLSRNESLLLAAQTVKGAAEMILKTGQHPGVLKDQVCSPGGTTIAGVDQLEQGGLRGTVIQAVKAATRRSLTLAGSSDEEISRKFNL